MVEKAQGTIEYLVMLAVIIIIGLLVVGVSSNFFDSAGGISSVANQVSVSSGVISIIDAGLDSNGNAIVSLNNSSGDLLTITKINVGGTDKNYSEQLFFGNNKEFF